MVKPDPAADIVAQAPAALPPFPPPGPAQRSDAPTVELKHDEIASVPSPASGAPVLPSAPAGIDSAAAGPTPADDRVKPRDHIDDGPNVATADRIPEISAQPMPPSAPGHHALTTESIAVRFVAALPGAPPTPAVASQAGAAFVVLAREGDGTHHLTLLLQPPDLGELRITVEQGKDSPAKITVTAANPATLLTLLRDQPALNQALDSAGINGDGRMLTFHLAATRDPSPVVATQSGHNPGDAAQSQGGGQNAGLSDLSPQTQSGSGGRGGHDQHPARHEPSARPWFADIPQVAQSLDPTRPTLTAIDITA